MLVQATDSCTTGTEDPSGHLGIRCPLEENKQPSRLFGSSGAHWRRTNDQAGRLRPVGTSAGSASKQFERQTSKQFVCVPALAVGGRKGGGG